MKNKQFDNSLKKRKEKKFTTSWLFDIQYSCYTISRSLFKFMQMTINSDHKLVESTSAQHAHYQ